MVVIRRIALFSTAATLIIGIIGALGMAGLIPAALVLKFAIAKA